MTRIDPVTRKAAHRRALQLLAKEYKLEHQIFAAEEAAKNPNLPPSEISRKAHSRLRQHLPHRFDEIYRKTLHDAGINGIKSLYDGAAERIVELYGDGTGPTLKSIARDLGVSYWFAKKSASDAGIKPRRGNRSESGKEKRMTTQEKRAAKRKWKGLYEQGMSIREIADRSEWSSTTVRTCLKEAGVTFRRSGRPSRKEDR